MLVTVKGPLPLLVSVTVLAALVVSNPWLEKVREVGDRLTPGALAPVPVSAIVCGLPTTLSAMVTVPVSVPVAVGVNVTLIVQAAPAASDVPQLFVWPKFALAVIDVMEITVEPILVKVTGCVALVVPTV